MAATTPASGVGARLPRPTLRRLTDGADPLFPGGRVAVEGVADIGEVEMASADLAAQPVLLRVLVRLIVLLTVLGEPVMALHWRPLPQGRRGGVIAADLLGQTCLRFGSVVIIWVPIRGLFVSQHSVLTVSVSGDLATAPSPVAGHGPAA